jgi:hypothetical protein
MILYVKFMPKGFFWQEVSRDTCPEFTRGTGSSSYHRGQHRRADLFACEGVSRANR